MSGFNNSTRRDDISLKLRSQNMRHTREQTKKLEEDSRKMEDRLKELKTAMSREKEERERQGGGFWGRGQTETGSLTSYASEVLHSKVEKPAKEGKKKKIKLLQDEPIEVPKRSSQPGTVKYIAQRKLTTGSTPRDKGKGPKCGQCEERSATLSCVQCSEIYCAGCFAAFHLKGALKQHRSCPISAVGGRVCMSPRPAVDASSPRGSQASGSVVSYPKETYPVDGSEASGPRSSHTTPRQQEDGAPRQQGDGAPRQQGDGGATLLEGDYNESQSAASFQQALMAWRTKEETPPPQPSARKSSRPIASPVKDPIVSMDSSTGTTEETKMPDIKFTGSLSYVEKLMLKKHRRTELDESSTPRLSDQSESSSRLSDRSGISSASKYSHQRERISRQGDARISSPSSRRGHRGRYENERSSLREQSFVDDGERVDFQSLYQAVMSTDGSGYNTPRSGVSVTDVTESPINYGVSPTAPQPPSTFQQPYVTEEVTPYESWAIEDQTRRESSSRSSAPKSAGESAALNSQRVLPDKFTSSKPNSKYAIEDMFPQQPSPQTPRDEFGNPVDEFGDTTPRPTSVIERQREERYLNKKRQESQQQSLSLSSTFPSDDEASRRMLSSTALNEMPQQEEEITRPKSSKSKSRPGSTRPKTATKSRPASRAQSRAASRMMMAEGLLTKTPSKALSDVANLAHNNNDTNFSSTTLTYQSPLEGFFLAGVDMAALTEQSNPPQDKTITPSKYASSSSTSLTQQQRPKSRSSQQAGLKSARGERETIKVSNRLYQMAPRSWRPDSSLGETIPLSDVRVEDGVGDDDDDMVLAYSYSGQMTGRATEWRPTSSQSGIEADSQYDQELYLIEQSSSSHPHGDRKHHTNNTDTTTTATTTTTSGFGSFSRQSMSRSDTVTPDLGQGDSTNPRSYRHHQPQQPVLSPQQPTLPLSDVITASSTTSSTRRKSANRRSLGTSSSLSSTTPTPTPMTPEIPPTPKTPTNKNPRPLSSRNATSASLRRSKILNAENEKFSSSSSDFNHQNTDLSSKDITRPPITTSKSSTSAKKSQLMGNLLPSKSEIPFTTTTRSKSKIATTGNDLERESMSRSNTQTSGIVRSGTGTKIGINVSRGPSRPSSKNSTSGGGVASLSRRHSNVDETQHQYQQQQQQNQRPNSSTVVTTSGSANRQRPALSATKGRPVSSTVSQERSGRNPMMASQSMDMEGRQDSIIADVMSNRVHHEDGWMAGDDDVGEDGDGGGYDDGGGDDDGNYYHDGEEGYGSRSQRDVTKAATSSKKISDSSHWETEVRPFTRESLDSAKVRQRLDQGYNERGMSTRPSSTMSGRESRAVVMDGEDLSAYDGVMDTEEDNQEDKQALEQLEWELASDTGRLTADGQISRLGTFEQDEYSGSHSSSRSSSSRSLRFCADRDYDLTSKLLEDERQAEQASLNVDMERNGTLDEDEVKALR